ncbi:MAG TPA: cytochrome P450 [Frankiaceae bacterium]|nr:cytochrome P450 [Frankiaceae bacterium]
MTDSTDPDFFRDPAVLADPYPYYEFLRTQGPVYREPHHGVVMVTGYDEARTIYSDVASFSSCNSVSGPFPGFTPPLAGPAVTDVTELVEAQRDELPMHDQIICFDPPKHTDHRALLMRLLTPRRLAENEDFMWKLADRQIDTFIERGSVEFISEYASPFAFLVIADLLGVPEQDRATFMEDMQGKGRRRAMVGSAKENLEHNPLGFLYDWFSRYVEDRRREPRQDVLTGLATATFPDGSLPEVIDVVRVAVNLFAAGQETTVRLLGSALQLIAERPEIQEELRANHDRIPDFVEEMLRYESPVKGSFRLAQLSTTVGGIDIPAGTTVMLLNGAASRDASRFGNCDEFELDRAGSRQHLAFGRGVHSCPGGPLARVEARVSVQRLLERLGDIRISQEHHGPLGERRFKYVPTFILRGLTALHLDFPPGTQGTVTATAG